MNNQSLSAKKKVLVVDDEPSVLYSVERVLEVDYIVIKATDGEDALELAKIHKPDVILMDTMMPKKHGLMASHEIKANEATRSIPIIMLTGIGYELNKKLAKEFGVDG